MAVEATIIDPRDVTREVNDPAYRVYFHDADGASEEHRLTGIDMIGEVVSWAAENASGRTYVIYVEVSLDDGETVLARVQGQDPNAL